jgi:N-acyl-D-amino-acid deacylase
MTVNRWIAGWIALIVPVCAFAASYDLVIKNGTIIDGTGAARFGGDIAIKDGRVVAIGTVQGDATTTIDAQHHIVAPGFIDVHTHADTDLYKLPHAENFVRDGVTTIVVGNCGGSVLHPKEYFDHLKKNGVAVNVATLIGHNSVLREVKGDKAGELSVTQMTRAKGIVRQAMIEGAVGFSTGLIYTPGQFSSTEEIVELQKVAADFGGIYATHMRSESGGVMDAIDEALRIGREAKCRVEISHFKLPHTIAMKLGSDSTLKKVLAAREAGQDVWLDQYPYTASSTTISTLLPDWVLEKGGEEARRTLRDPIGLRRALDDMRQNFESSRARKDMSYVVIASCKAFPTYAGLNLKQVAIARKQQATTKELLESSNAKTEVTMEDQYRAAIDIYLAGGASCVFHTMDEQEVETIMKCPIVSVASDSGVRQFGRDMPHPRGYGTNTRVLGRYVRERKIITLEDAVRKMSSQPAMVFGFKDRGAIKVGNWADLTIFDAEKVNDKATFEQPHQYPVGIDAVVVNGKVVFENEKMTDALPGVPLYGPGYVRE